MAKDVSEETQVETHNVSLSFLKAPPAEITAGSEMVLQLSLVCSLACNMTGKTVAIMNGEELISNSELIQFDGTANCTEEFTLHAPAAPGEYTWEVVFPSEPEPLHQECRLAFNFSVTSHSISMAVWDSRPSPVEVDSVFTTKFGVKCTSAGCSLAGTGIEIYDQEGMKVGAGILSDTVYTDTASLHWTELELRSPSEAGQYKWQVRFPQTELDVPHENACHTFGFTVAKRAECELTVEVVEKDTGVPLKNAQISVRPNRYQAITDDDGVARVALPRGDYRIRVFASERAPLGLSYSHADGRRMQTNGTEYKLYVPESNQKSRLPFEATVTLEDDTTIRAELVGVIEPPEEDGF